MRTWELFWYTVGRAIGNAVAAGRTVAHHILS